MGWASTFKRISPAWRDSLLAFLGGRVFYSLVGAFIWWTKFMPAGIERYYYEMTPLVEGPAGALLGVWQRWDGVHYQRIVTSGYFTDQVSAFYPLYPLLARGLAGLTHWHPLLALVVVSNVALFFSLVLLHKIVSRQFSASTARATLAGLVLFPSGYYLYAIYPQSLLLLLVLTSTWFARDDRWAYAAAAAFLAGLTHSTAVVVSFLLGIEALFYLWPSLADFRAGQFRWNWNLPLALLAPLAAPAGMGAFLAWREWAGFIPFFEIQKQMGGRAFFLPWDGLVAVVRFILAMPIQADQVVNWMNALVFWLTIGLTIWSFRRIPWSWWVAQVGLLVFFLSNMTVYNPLLGFFRYILPVFPVFVALSLAGQSRPWRLVKFGITLLLAFIFSAMFFMWQDWLG